MLVAIKMLDSNEFQLFTTLAALYGVLYFVKELYWKNSSIGYANKAVQNLICHDHFHP